MIGAWLAAFVATCAVEVAIVRLVVPRARVAVVVAAQLATHPLVFVIATSWHAGPAIARLAVLEALACAVEAAIYARWLRVPVIDAVAVSAVANASSLAIVALV